MSTPNDGPDAPTGAAAGAMGSGDPRNCPGCGKPGKQSMANDHHMRCKTPGCNVWKYFSFTPPWLPPFRVLVHDDLPPDVIVTLPGGMSDAVARRVAVEVAQRAARAATVTPAFTPALAPEKEDR